MYEVELKVRADHDAVRARLDDLGADRVGTVRQMDTYYDAPHRDFAATDEALRVREETDEGGETAVRLTYKGPLVEAASKTREEAETAVADGEALREVLAGLGFSPAATVAKNRTRFRVEGYTVSLDEVEGLGRFVEVERETAGDVESVREGATGVVRDLGLDPDEQVRTSYLGLLLADADE